MNGLTDREMASLVWIGLAAASAVFWRPMRRFATGVLGALLKPVLLVPFALLGLYTAALVGLASLTPAWNLDLLMWPWRRSRSKSASYCLYGRATLCHGFTWRLARMSRSLDRSSTWVLGCPPPGGATLLTLRPTV